MPNRVDLTLLGQTLTVRTDAPEEYLRMLASYLEERVGTLQKSGIPDTMKALLLAALDITDELFRAREDRDKSGELGARLGALVALLDRAVEPGGPGA